MENLLPIVDCEVGFSIARYMGEIPDREYIKQMLREIKKENPVIEEVIRRWANLDSHKLHVAFCGIMVYQLLKSQAEVDLMNKEINCG